MPDPDICLASAGEIYRLGVFGQLDLYPPSGWRVVQDIAASASSIPTYLGI